MICMHRLKRVNDSTDPWLTLLGKFQMFYDRPANDTCACPGMAVSTSWDHPPEAADSKEDSCGGQNTTTYPCSLIGHKLLYVIPVITVYDSIDDHNYDLQPNYVL